MDQLSLDNLRDAKKMRSECIEVCEGPVGRKQRHDVGLADRRRSGGGELLEERWKVG